MVSPTFLCKLLSGVGFEIIPITVLIFVNYAHLSRKMQKLCFCFYVKFGKNTVINYTTNR